MKLIKFFEVPLFPAETPQLFMVMTPFSDQVFMVFQINWSVTSHNCHTREWMGGLTTLNLESSSTPDPTSTSPEASNWGKSTPRGFLFRKRTQIWIRSHRYDWRSKLCRYVLCVFFCCQNLNTNIKVFQCCKAYQKYGYMWKDWGLNQSWQCQDFHGFG